MDHRTNTPAEYYTREHVPVEDSSRQREFFNNGEEAFSETSSNAHKGFILKRCPACGGYNLDNRESCGLCGANFSYEETVGDPSDPLPPPNRPSPRMLSGERRNIEAGVIAVAIGTVLTIVGLFVATTSVGYFYRILGLQLAIFGLITFLALILGTYSGLFSGWRGWYARK